MIIIKINILGTPEVDIICPWMVFSAYMSSFSIKFPTRRDLPVTSETALTIKKLINERKAEDSVQRFSFYKVGVKKLVAWILKNVG